MHGRFSELTGFACRWCLLALGGGAVALGSWAGLRGAGPAAEGLRARVTVGDTICRQSPDAEVLVTLYHSDSPARLGTVHMLARLGDGTQTVDSRGKQGRSAMFLPRRRAGLDDLRIVGIPYGQAAFTQARPVVKVVPDDREVFLIDGHLALVVGAETTAAPLAEAWRRCVKLMAARGATALFYGSTVEQRVSVRRRLLATCPGSGVGYIGPDRKAASRGFYLLVRGLLPKKAIFGRKKNTPEVPKRVTVVTDQRDIAVLAGRWGLATHLVGRSDKPIRDPDVTHHESVGLFEQYLRAGPGRQGGR